MGRDGPSKGEVDMAVDKEKLSDIVGALGDTDEILTSIEAKTSRLEALGFSRQAAVTMAFELVGVHVEPTAFASA